MANSNIVLEIVGKDSLTKLKVEATLLPKLDAQSHGVTKWATHSV